MSEFTDILKKSADKLSGCHVCGGKLVKIRGRYKGDPEREVCPTCLREMMDRIHEQSSSDYGRCYQDKEDKGQT